MPPKFRKSIVILEGLRFRQFDLLLRAAVRMKMSMERQKERKAELLGRKPVLVALYPPQIPHKVTQTRHRALNLDYSVFKVPVWI